MQKRTASLFFALIFSVSCAIFESQPEFENGQDVSVSDVGDVGDLDTNSDTNSDIGTEPTCTDEIQNGEEIDVDCGANCGPCEIGQFCRSPDDCLSEFCSQEVCTVPSCINNVLDDEETDLDCGGVCQGCDAGKQCVSGPDCVSMFCVDDVCTDGDWLSSDHPSRVVIEVSNVVGEELTDLIVPFDFSASGVDSRGVVAFANGMRTGIEVEREEVGWIRIARFLETTNVIHIYYGNPNFDAPELTPWSNDFVGVWHLGDATNSVSGVEGTSVNVVFDSGVFSRAGRFSGTEGGSRIVTPANNPDFVLPEMTASAWIRGTFSLSVSEPVTILSKPIPGSPFSELWWSVDQQVLQCTGSEIDTLETTQLVPDDTWTLVTLQISETQSRIFRDGQILLPIGTNNSFDLALETGFLIGTNARCSGAVYPDCEFDDDNEPFSGEIDEVRIRNRIVSPEHIRQRFETESPNGTAITSVEIQQRDGN